MKSFFLQRNSIFALMLFYLLTTACSDALESPEEQVRALIAQAETAAEERDSSALRALIDDEYLDKRGNDKKNIDAIIRVYLLRNQSIHLLTRIQELRLPAPGWAEVSLDVAMAGSPFPDSIDLTSFRADFQHIELTMRDTGGGAWRITQASWDHSDLRDPL